MAPLDSFSLFSTNVSSSYQVFLNFRGEDTRNNFVGFLHKTLTDRGIIVFLDEGGMKTGDAIDQSLEKAIKGSKIYIPVFSKRYAESKWCLQELSLMVECKKKSSEDHLILPIFFHVQPLDVERQTGYFTKAFSNYEITHKEDVGKWREAMNFVGNSTDERMNLTGVSINKNE
ncbi:hypothetical protein NE237_000875 [Protea cynaroides]|uniref:ADP-ribosyl cyclase/cyclic ADP-ribose hydrolase n=1 Tax=Protea cynaroides TaxID=273540 RepID=A0A9Q0KSE5_9MAGN|nr:hypothetical protein NE237_000875 [Protea cynaroides]